jgi:glycosyl transferase family 87
MGAVGRIEEARSGGESGRQRALGLGIFALAVVGALAGAGVAWQHLTGDPLADAHAYFDAANRLNHGLPLYPPGIDPSSNLVYLYPPLLAVALRPIALLPYWQFAIVWEAIVLVSFGLLIVQLGANRRVWLAIGILGIPIGWALSIAQAHVPMTLLLAIGQPWSVALAANVKIFPALVALWWLGRRDYQAFAAFVLWMFLWGLAQLVLEPRGTFEFLGGGVGLAQVGAVRNISPFAFGSPVLWVALVILGGLLTIRLARTRWGWAAAIALGTLSPPRLLVYMLTGLLAALREPRPDAPDPNAPVDASTAYLRSFR